MISRLVRPMGPDWLRGRRGTGLGRALSGSARIQGRADLSDPYPDTFDRARVEAGWYAWWQERGFFHAHPPAAPTFSLLLPPPNVTGTLHLGHALTATIQDILVRWKRMDGYRVMWVPGSDHAGIATQAVVEKHLRKKGIQARDLGRDKFLAEVGQWRHAKGDLIFHQLTQLGASLDWRRTTFTLDPSHCLAVNEAFVCLFERGLIYRALAPVNWSPQLQSAISDIEVTHVSVEKKTRLTLPGYERPVEFGQIFDIAYLVDGSSEEIVISTTRPETILGDVAVAVHPNDPRWLHLVGQKLRHPFRDELIPVIADSYVDPDFGTGALKITPAHDQNDFAIGQRHNLPLMEVIDETGCINLAQSPFHGLPRFTARWKIIEALKSQGLFRCVKAHKMLVPTCSRSGDVIEKLVKPQWFVKCDQMAERARKSASDGSLAFHPASYHNVWEHWLGNIQDWCISRQLWWGHRIPVWRCQSGGDSTWIAARNEEEAHVKAVAQMRGSSSPEFELHQEEDVLDTWFSSALLPFANFGWPHGESNPDRGGFPNSLMETGHDILFFWVARMVMLSQELTQQLPFKTVLLHGIVCDGQGRKMSKSLGNVIDPLHLIEGYPLDGLCQSIEESNANGIISDVEMLSALEGVKKEFPNGIPACGADGLRNGLISYDIKAQHIRLDMNLMRTSAAFCNKIWQSTRFLVISMERSSDPIRPQEASLPQNKWILSRLAATVKEVNESFESYDFYLATRALRKFMYTNLCDVYLESIKHILAEKSHPDFGETIATLQTAMISGLTLLHPIMPFITEELYHRIPYLEGETRAESVMVAKFPKFDEMKTYHDEKLMSEMDQVLAIVTALRDLKKTYELKRAHLPEIVIETQGDLTPYEDVLSNLAQVGGITWTRDARDVDLTKFSKSIVSEDRLFMNVEGLIDPEKEFAKLEKNRAKVFKELAKLELKMTKGPKVKDPDLQRRNQERLEQIQDAIGELTRREEWLKSVA